MDIQQKGEGVAGEHFHSLPRPLLAPDHPLTQALYVTDIGWYPNARHHFRARPKGTDEHILLLCARGTGWAEIHDHRFRLTRGQALLIPRNEPHVYAADEHLPWSIHWAHLKGDLTPFYLRLLPDGDYRIPLAAACLHEAETVFRSAYTALADSYSPSNLIYVAQLAHHLLGLLFYRNAAYSPALRAPATNDVQATADFITEHCNEPLTRERLARHAGLSVAHFSLLFHRQTGLSSIQFLIQQRMRRACHQLDTTSRAIHSIATDIGYSDPYYFSRLFKQTMGLSPRRYRNNRKG